MGTLIRRRRYGHKHDEAVDYLTFTATAADTFKLVISSSVSVAYIKSISYSTNNGATWTKVNNVSNQAVTISVNVVAGQRVLWKGEGYGFAVDLNNGSRFYSNNPYAVSGNIMSLLYDDDFKDKTSISAQYAFTNLFKNCKITSMPLLPATTLANYCYYSMFYECSLLTKAKDLPATSLKQYCYSQMFYGCTALEKAPKLPATTLANYCYGSMFVGCTSLRSAPDLLATTLVTNCYSYMFYGCSALQYVKALFTTTPSTSYTNNWLYNVSASGYFVKNSTATWNVRSVHGIPSKWTVITDS